MNTQNDDCYAVTIENDQMFKSQQHNRQQLKQA